MKAEIRQFNVDSEYFFDEGCYIVEVSNHAGDPALSIARVRVPPGVSTRWHKLKDTVERYVILEGEGLVEVGGLQSQQVRSGDTVIIPAQCPQRITNNGASDLIFLALCTPRFDPNNYQSMQ